MDFPPCLVKVLLRPATYVPKVAEKSFTVKFMCSISHPPFKSQESERLHSFVWLGHLRLTMTIRASVLQ